MARNDPQMNLRVPMELKERIASQVELRAEERSKFARGLALLQAK